MDPASLTWTLRDVVMELKISISVLSTSIFNSWIVIFKYRCVIHGLHCCFKEIFALRGCYVALIGGQLPTFRDTLSVSSAKVKQSKICFRNS